MPRQIRIVVVLPAPFAPRKPKTAPPGDLEGQARRARRRAEPLGDVVDLEAHAPRIAACPGRVAVRPMVRVPGRPRRQHGVRSADAYARCTTADRPRSRSTPIAPPGRLEIDWDDGHATTYDTTTLRWLCPCAFCRGEAGPARLAGQRPDPDRRADPAGRHLDGRRLRDRAALGRRPPHRLLHVHDAARPLPVRRRARGAPRRPSHDRSRRQRTPEEHA